MPITMWRRLDLEGMEVCAIDRTEAGQRVWGTAIFAAGTTPHHVRYSVDCDRNWVCRGATVERWVEGGRRDIALQVDDDGGWHVNGQARAGVEDAVDIDLGFTPATNTVAIRRLDLRVGEGADVTAVWLDDSSWTFKPLRQRYERLGETTYKYTSLESGYEAHLTVDGYGLVRSYPGLWEALAGTGAG